MSRSTRREFFALRFGRGLSAALRGAGMLLGNRRLALLSLVPFLLCAAIYAVLLALVVVLSDDVAGLMLEPGSWWRAALRTVLMIALPVAFLVLAAFTYTAACVVLAGPLYEWLSVAVERELHATGEEEPFSLGRMVSDLLRSVKWALTVLLVQVAVLVLSFVFVPVTTVLAFVLSAVLLSLEYLDYPMERRRLATAQKLRYARAHLWELMGLGLPLLAGLMVPFVGVFTMPVGVAGGTLLFVELERAEAARKGAGTAPG